MAPESGVTLSIKSSSVGWLSEADDALCHEINRCAPWWGIFRRRWMQSVSIVFAILIGLAVPAHTKEWLSILLGGLIGFNVSFYGGKILLRFLPGFEVVATGTTSKGRRSLGAIGAVMLSALAAVAGIIYAAVQAGTKK